MLKAIYATLRLEIRGRENLKPFWDEGRPVICAFWHGRLLLMPYAWWKVGRGEAYILMGRNRNGELITRIVSRFNMKAIRGGSSAGGEEARKEMLEVMARSPRTTLGITPDGPRGPRYESKMGIAWASRTLDVPVIWIAASTRWGLRTTTWDRFLVPLPFSKAVIAFGPPTSPADHADLDLDAWRRLLDAIGRRQTLALDREMGNLAEDDLPLLEPPSA